MDGVSAGPLIVALDQERPDEARRCMAELGDSVRRYKIGSVLFTRTGPALVRELTGRGLGFFLDLKFHDTPATVARAVAAAVELGVELLSLHAAGGSAMIREARRVIEEARVDTRLLAVTLLTSLGPEDYAQITGEGARALPEAVIALARLAVDAGAHGCVASVGEVAALRAELGPEPLLVVPGIRPGWSTADHSGQVRTGSPAEALRAGATDLVIGRAVTAAEDPAAAVRRIRAEIAA